MADTRRMNVAITRAKRALWVVGSATALRRGDPTWRALLEDAESRGCVITVRCCRLLSVVVCCQAVVVCFEAVGVCGVPNQSHRCQMAGPAGGR